MTNETAEPFFRVPARTLQSGDFLRHWGRVNNVSPAAGKSIRVNADGGQFHIHMDALVSVLAAVAGS